MENTQKDQDLEARREARRRKILENAKNRLGKITGREVNDSEIPAVIRETAKTAPEPVPEKVIYPDPELERDVYERPVVANPFAEQNPFENQEFLELLTNMQQNPGGLPGFPGDLPPNAFFDKPGLFGPPPPQMPDTNFTKLLKSKLHIGLLAMLTYFFIAIGYSCNVFLIFLIWEMVEMFILKQYENKSGSILSILFMFSGISPAKLNVMFKWIQIINRVLRDVAIFLFFFLVSHICCGRTFQNRISASPVVESLVEESFEDEFAMEF